MNTIYKPNEETLAEARQMYIRTYRELGDNTKEARELARETVLDSFPELRQPVDAMRQWMSRPGGGRGNGKNFGYDDAGPTELVLLGRSIFSSVFAGAAVSATSTVSGKKVRKGRVRGGAALVKVEHLIQRRGSIPDDETSSILLGISIETFAEIRRLLRSRYHFQRKPDGHWAVSELPKLSADELDRIAGLLEALEADPALLETIRKMRAAAG